ncbi:hypothetical protein ACH4GP_02785 [Streptomyces celluloflavus]|uniref:Uncharacterized protein n=1 Tax=Streptomyces celluloflavus TaxID=58344 RepID=A0ABW7R5H4_9ACTN
MTGPMAAATALVAVSDVAAAHTVTQFATAVTTAPITESGPDH